MLKNQKILIVFILLWSPILLAQTSIYVSPRGSDANTGTASKPFASISKAVAEALKISGEAVIYLTEGS